MNGSQELVLDLLDEMKKDQHKKGGRYPYRGLCETARALGVSHTHLREVLRGKRKASEQLASALRLLIGISVPAQSAKRVAKEEEKLEVSICRGKKD